MILRLHGESEDVHGMPINLNNCSLTLIFKNNSTMHDDDEDDWLEKNEDNLPKNQNSEIQKLLAEMESKAKKAMHYLVLEGFVEPMGTPGLYKYTPEGAILAQQQYKKMQDEGLI